MPGRGGIGTHALGQGFRPAVGFVASALLVWWIAAGLAGPELKLGAYTCAYTPIGPAVGPELQLGAGPSQQLPTFRAEARLVRVDAYVTEGDRPVEGLRPEDFDVLEDGVRQKIENLEYVRQGQVVSGRVPGEPETRGRLFVMLVDTYHLPWIDRDRLERRQRNAPKYEPEPFRFPLVLPPPIPDDGMFREGLDEIINRVVGDEDRIAVLTPDMWAGSLTFTDRKSAVEEMATRSLKPYVAGQRPPELNHFEACFPDGPDIEETMRVRYRLYRTFTALGELMGNLEMLREERKAVFVVTRGWDAPPRIQYYRDPRSGMVGEDETVCHEERLALADRDFDAWWRSIIEDAKRANVALYTIYAHPLVTYGREGADIDEDTRRFQRQWGDAKRNEQRLLYGEFPAITHDRYLWHEALKKMAKDTNGRAILSMEDFEKGLKEIRDTLSSFYLLGYYSTNTKRDGAFRKITVNVRRRGVMVRARPGYRAVIPAEADAAASAALPDLVPPAILAALAPLARSRDDLPFRLVAAPEWNPAAAAWQVRVIGEIDVARARRDAWRRGWRADVTLAGGDGTAVESSSVVVKAGQAAFSLAMPAGGALQAGDYDVRAKASGSDADDALEERAAVSLPASSAPSGSAVGRPLLWRRPNAPRAEFQPTADQRFSRREVLRIDVPFAATGAAPEMRLVDRQGRSLAVQIPTAIGEADGGRVLSGTLGLTNVAPGEYVIEISSTAGGDQKTYIAFRVVP